MQLPPPLRQAIEDLAANAKSGELREASETVSNRYRHRAEALQVRNADEALGYLATRLPATYAAASHVMTQVQKNHAGFNPSSLLDMGAGPGTVTLAAMAQWNIADASLLEPNENLRSAGQKIFQTVYGNPANWIASDIRSAALPERQYDLVVSGYVLNEIESDVERVVEKLWRVTGNTLIIIEPGTPQGSGIILRARDALLKEGAHIIAPCPHIMKCPLHGVSKRWCHFSERVERSRLHRQAKNAALGYEDEKFSYIAVTRHKVAPRDFRVIGHPSGTKLIHLQVCDKQGRVDTVQIPKSDPRHKVARRLEWGDAPDFAALHD